MERAAEEGAIRSAAAAVELLSGALHTANMVASFVISSFFGFLRRIRNLLKREMCLRVCWLVASDTVKLPRLPKMLLQLFLLCLVSDLIQSSFAEYVTDIEV